MRTGALLPLVLVTLTSCATMIHDRHERIPVGSEPAGAVVSVDCGNAATYGGVTPTTIVIERKADPCTLTIAKEGYLSERIFLERQISRATAANQVPGAILGSVATAIALLSDGDLNPVDSGSAIFDIGRELGSAPGNAVDRATGGAYKHVPGSVFVELRPERP